MNAAFLLLTSAWLTGADPCCGGGCAAPCGDCGCGCCCKPTLRERFDAFRNACGSPSCCGCCDCCGCCCKPTLRDRFDAFRNACGAPKCCGCCAPCCDTGCAGCGAPGIGHGAPMAAPIAPKGAEPIGLPKGKDNKPLPEGGPAADAPGKIGAGVPQLEATPVANPKGTVIIEPETTRTPF